MLKPGLIVKEGIVKESLPNAMFKVELNDKSEIVAQASGKMQRFFIKVLPGDRVKVEMSIYDNARGRIVFRY